MMTPYQLLSAIRIVGKDSKAIDGIIQKYKFETNDGGPGSGNFGHKGRLGHVGGSSNESSSKSRIKEAISNGDNSEARKQIESLDVGSLMSVNNKSGITFWYRKKEGNKWELQGSPYSFDSSMMPMLMKDGKDFDVFEGGFDYENEQSSKAKERIRDLRTSSKMLERQIKKDDLDEAKKKELQQSLDYIRNEITAAQNAIENADTNEQGPNSSKSQNSKKSKTREKLQILRIDNNEPKKSKRQRSQDQIVKDIAGSDRTNGSCASLAYAYCACIGGYDVLDFRGGDSREIFASTTTFTQISQMEGVNPVTSDIKNDAESAIDVIDKLDTDRQYVFASGQHVTVMRKNKGGDVQYLQLQDGQEYGWKSMGKTAEDRMKTLSWRFHSFGWSDNYPARAIPVDELASNQQFIKITGHLNTNADEQEKGYGGHMK